ncbi:MAG: 30S ribosome-binding factor RbfA [Chloroflexi bacterium]|nr:30S ribosome-binding factor RbfA [Chloroflexota bacterium]
MPSRRILRVNELLRDEIAELLRRETDDPLLQTMISIVEVDTSPDLKKAKVYVSVFGDEDQAAKVFQQLRRASRFLRRELAKRIELRYVPELEFVLDTSIARGAKIMALLHQIGSGNK